MPKTKKRVNVREKTTDRRNEIQENKALEAKTRRRGGWIGKPLNRILMLLAAS